MRMEREHARVVRLPAPCVEGRMSVEAALYARESLRDYRAHGLALAELSQLVWSAQGATGRGERRTAPSAGALYPLELYVLAGAVEELETGLYRYRPAGHELVQVAGEDRREELAAAALGQESVERAEAVIVIAGVVERTALKYGQRAIRYVHMEVGAAAENVYLQATALGLGTVFIGAFSDTRVRQVLELPAGAQAFAILPVGRPG